MSKRRLKVKVDRPKPGPVEKSAVQRQPQANGNTRNRQKLNAARLNELSLSGALATRITWFGVCAFCEKDMLPGVGHFGVKRGGRWIHANCETPAKQARQGMLYTWEKITA